MAKNTGLGKGLDSLIPDISSENDEQEESISLEDLLKKDSSEDEVKEDLNKDEEQEKQDEQDEQDQDIEELEKIDDSEDVDDVEEETLTEDVEDNQVEEIEEVSTSENISSETVENDSEDDSGNDVVDDSEDDVKIVEEPIKNIEEKDDTTQIIEEESHENDVDVLLTKKQEEDICKVIEIVENNPRITLWSAKSAAVLRYLRKTEPEFSISNEASKLIEEAIAEKYPEIWTLFDHL